jgi:hypothetical protein
MSNFFQALRLDFIDMCLATRGGINRADLCRAFNICKPQATTDISQFMATYPKAIRYDASAKRFVPTATPYVRYRKHPAKRLLKLLATG